LWRTFLTLSSNPGSVVYETGLLLSSDPEIVSNKKEKGIVLLHASFFSTDMIRDVKSLVSGIRVQHLGSTTLVTTRNIIFVFDIFLCGKATNKLLWYPYFTSLAFLPGTGILEFLKM
jgi:hypothetical protein